MTIDSVRSALVGVMCVIATAGAQERVATARSLRCTFPRNATGTWTKAGAAASVLKPSTLVLRFESINVDEGTAQLMTGSMGQEVTVKQVGAYLHFMQIFRTGPLYTTTVFDKDGKEPLKAVHTRHEYLPTPLAGATSSPEQYYGTCEVTARTSE